MKKISKDVFHRIPEEAFRKLIAESTSIRQVFVKMDLCVSGDQYIPFKRRVEELNIDLSHFKGQYKKGERFNREIPIEQTFCEGTHYNGKALVTKIKKYNLLPYNCSKCGLGDSWQGNPLSLQIDHINGTNSDNRLENLRFLCPNCHTQTPTYAGRKRKTHRHCEKCGGSCKKRSKICRKCSEESFNKKREQRATISITKWPSREELEALVWTKPLSVLAKDYERTGNGLKRHCQKLGIKYPSRGYWRKRQLGYSHEESLVSQKINRPAKRFISNEEIRVASELLKTGFSIREIAIKLGYAHTTIARGLKRLSAESTTIRRSHVKA